jgi:hypothetical protein
MKTNAEMEDAESMISSNSSVKKSDRTDSVRLRLKEESKLPLEAEVLSPDVIGKQPGKSRTAKSFSYIVGSLAYPFVCR